MGKYTPNNFIQGDTGISPPYISQWRAIGRQVCRMSNMKNNRINKCIYNWARGNCKNSIFTVLKFFSDHGLGIDVENLSSGRCINEILPKIETILED